MRCGALTSMVGCVAMLLAAEAHAGLGVTLADGTPAARPDIDAAARGLGLSPEELTAHALADAPGWVGNLALAPCSSAPGPASLATVVAEAREQIGMLAADQAETALEAAVRALPCATEGVDRADLLAAFEVWGEASQSNGNEGNARFAYEALLAADPSYVLTSPPGTGYEELFNAVRRMFVAQSPAAIGVHHRLAGEAAVRWDGAPVASDARVPLSVLPGRHLLQWTVGGALRGAWVEIPVGGAAGSIVWGPDRPALLASGLSDVGSRAAIEPLLRAEAARSGLDGLVVLPAAGAGKGFVVDAGRAEPWADAEVALGRTMRQDRLRALVGAGYANLQLTHYGDVTAAIDVRVVGPLHVRLDADLAISQPLDGRLPGYADQGKVAVLPGVGVGVAIRPARGLIQPFGALSIGAWFGAKDAEAAARLEAALAAGAFLMSQVDRGKLDARHAVDLRMFVDGGLDLIPVGGPFVVRVGLGVGLGMGLSAEAPVGFQLRAGAAAGVRFGGGAKMARGEG